MTDLERSVHAQVPHMDTHHQGAEMTLIDPTKMEAAKEWAPMSVMTEYRVVHELGPQYATPTRFIDMWQAQEMVKKQRQLARMIGMAHTADGWYVESRTFTDWQKVDTDE